MERAIDATERLLLSHRPLLGYREHAVQITKEVGAILLAAKDEEIAQSNRRGADYKRRAVAAEARAERLEEENARLREELARLAAHHAGWAEPEP